VVTVGSLGRSGRPDAAAVGRFRCRRRAAPQRRGAAAVSVGRGDAAGPGLNPSLLTRAVHAVSVSGLKPNPEGGLLQAPGARDALATALFWDGELSLVRSAHAAKPPSGSRPPPPPPLIPAGGSVGELPGLQGRQPPPPSIWPKHWGGMSGTWKRSQSQLITEGAGASN